MSSDDIRTWLDTTYPLKGKGKECVSVFDEPDRIQTR